MFYCCLKGAFKFLFGAAVCILLIVVIIYSSLQPRLPQFNTTEWNWTLALLDY
jgi:hypothetical protein